MSPTDLNKEKYLKIFFNLKRNEATWMHMLAGREEDSQRRQRLLFDF